MSMSARGQTIAILMLLVSIIQDPIPVCVTMGSLEMAFTAEVR